MNLDDINHLLIIDDDDRIRSLLGKYLADNGMYVTLAENAADARVKMQSFKFDLFVVDVMMPGETGVEFTFWLKKRLDTPVLMLTAMGEVEDRVLGLENGADDYLSKPFEPRELLLRIKNLLQRGGRKAKKSLFKFGNIEFDPAKETLKKDNADVEITSSESKLLAILCVNMDKIVTREELSRLHSGINERSIDVQITRLRNKIEDNTKKPSYLKTVRGKGYILHGN